MCLPSLLQKVVVRRACIDDGPIYSWTKPCLALGIFYLSRIDFIILTEVAPIKQMMIKIGTLSAAYLTNNARSISDFVQPLSPTSLLFKISHDSLRTKFCNNKNKTNVAPARKYDIFTNFSRVVGSSMLLSAWQKTIALWLPARKTA